MSGPIKRVRLADLHGKRVVGADGIEVKVPEPPSPPKLPEKSQADTVVAGLVRVGAEIAGEVRGSAAQVLAGLIAVADAQRATAEAQRATADALASRKPVKRWSIKVRREAGQIVDMTATPEH